MKFHSTPIAENPEVPLADDGLWESIVEHWQRWQPAEAKTTDDEHSHGVRNPDVRIDPSVHTPKNHCYIASIGDWDDERRKEAQLSEIRALVSAVGDDIVGWESCRLVTPQARTYLKAGRALEIANRAVACGADMLVVDAELSPSQLRNLENATGLAVCDREAVILNVFLKHAHTRRAKIQVEIAQLEYLRPRIRGLGLTMDQQAGGVMRGRGPGETASELMARHLDQRLAELRKASAKLSRSGRTQRQNRTQCRRIALIGYTNAGKTSIMNGLTTAGLSAKDQPFETLDTTTRCLDRQGDTVLLSDTVGFIRNLPARLLDSFESTLAELGEASLLLEVVDITDFEWPEHLRLTDQLLTALAATHLPRLVLFNKRDRLTEQPALEHIEQQAAPHECMLVSAHDVGDMARLKERLLALARSDQHNATIFVPYRAQHILRQVYKQCRVLQSRANERGVQLVIAGQPHVVRHIQTACREMRQ